MKDEFKLSNEAGNLIAPENNFVINTSLPIENLNTSSWKLESYSIAQDFTAKISEINPFKILVNSSFKPTKKYVLTIPKETVSSYYSSNDKSFQFQFEIDKPENYGSFTAVIKNKPTAKFWV